MYHNNSILCYYPNIQSYETYVYNIVSLTKDMKTHTPNKENKITFPSNEESHCVNCNCFTEDYILKDKLLCFICSTEKNY